MRMPRRGEQRSMEFLEHSIGVLALLGVFGLGEVWRLTRYWGERHDYDVE